MDTLREKIIAAFAVKISAGRCLRLDGDSQLPARSLWDNAEEAQRTKYNSMYCTLELPVECMHSVDTTTYSSFSAQANAILGEIIQDATAGDNTLGGLCKTVKYTGCEFVYPDDGSREMTVYCAFEVNYEFAAGDPFTAA